VGLALQERADALRPLVLQGQHLLLDLRNHHITTIIIMHCLSPTCSLMTFLWTV